MTGFDIDFGSFATLGDDLIPRLDALRDHDPLFWSDSCQGWLVTSHALVEEGFSGRVPLSAKRHHMLAGAIPDPVDREQVMGHILEIIPDFVINTDPPEQSRLRKLLLTAFTRQVAESYRPRVREIVDEILSSIEGRSEIDFVHDVARPITARAILQVIGLPPDCIDKLEHWAVTINSGLGGHADRAMLSSTNQVMKEMRDFFLAEIDRSDRPSGNDFLSHLLNARDGNEQLSRNEIVAQLILILIAGHDTTLNTMALSVARLARLPAARAFLRDHPERFDACIMELMRVVAMSTSQARIVSQDFEWAGKSLQAGERVFLVIAAANRDPLVFPNAAEVDFDRPQTGNMTFAPGKHFCIGHWFAKMMMSEILPSFLERYESWDMIDDRVMFTAAAAFRGPVRMPMRLHRRHAA